LSLYYAADGSRCSATSPPGDFGGSGNISCADYIRMIELY